MGKDEHNPGQGEEQNGDSGSSRPDPQPDDGVAWFELHFCPSVELISVVRRFIYDFLQRILHEKDTVSRVALATHELLENAVRYSTDGTATIRIEVDRSDVPAVIIRIDNHAAPEHLPILEASFAELRAEPDAFEHYCKVMARNAKRTDGSGLGLARIRAEAEMDLDYELHGDVVRICARTAIADEDAT